MLAREHPVAADMVVPVLDSGTSAALGYAEESGIPYETALIRNHYVRRTFIEPSQSIRHFGVKVKHNAVRGILAGKRVVLVEDSIVRGTTLMKMVTMLRQAGAREVHVRVSSPPIIGPCHYGIDTPTRDELIAHRHTVDGDPAADPGATRSATSRSRACAAWPRQTLSTASATPASPTTIPVAVSDDEAVPQLSLFRSVEEETEEARQTSRGRERPRSA